MGYRRNRTIYKLVFADEEMNGLEVRCTSVSIDAILRLVSLASLKDKKFAEFSPEDLQAVDVVFEVFAKALVSWNLEEDDGTPVPATMEGIRSQDFDFVNVIIKTWMERVAGISGPLDRNSTAGLPSLEASLKMEPLSPNLMSSSTPS